jgi:hypothetical protein
MKNKRKPMKTYQVLVDRMTVPTALGDCQINFFDSIEVPGKVVAIHPIQNLAVVKHVTPILYFHWLCLVSMLGCWDFVQNFPEADAHARWQTAVNTQFCELRNAHACTSSARMQLVAMMAIASTRVNSR